MTIPTAGVPEVPARDVFPEFRVMPALFEDEVLGLGEDELNRRRPEKRWGGWSIKEQVSHVAWIPFLIFQAYWGEVLFGKSAGLSVISDRTGNADRMLDPVRFGDMEDILIALHEGFELGWNILGRETLGSLCKKYLTRRIDPGRVWPTGERVIDYFETLVLPAHEMGLRRDPNDLYLFHQTLESAMRHIVWEAFAHLKTIQFHKHAEGLPTGPPVPEEGYTALLKWD